MNNRDQKVYVFLSVCAIALTSFFAQWWFQPDHIPLSKYGSLGLCVNVLLFVMVSYVVWHPIVMQLFYWAVAFQLKVHTIKQPAAGLRVALLTTFVPQSEPIELLEMCLPAMTAVEYPHDTWLLDEGDSLEARKLCKKLGVHYHTRRGNKLYNSADGKFSTKTKGGNHNSWYDQHASEYDFVAQMDTDFIPDPSYLLKTLGEFNDPDVGFVGTPQIYGNTEESVIARGAAQQAYNFFGPILRGFSGMDTSLLIGANHVVRVSALLDVDLYSAHITEDLLTGMKLHANGWKSIYVPEALAVGEGPSSWPAFFNQQMRWAYGCIDVLFHHSPKLLQRMSCRRAFYYFFLQQYYFSGLAMMLGLLGLGLYAAFGVTTARMGLLTFLLYYAPVILICEVMSLWLQRFNILPKTERGLLISGRITSLAAWPIFLLALFGVLAGKRLTYQVTPKGEAANKVQSLSFKEFAFHLVIATYSVICIVIALLERHISVVIFFWLGLSALIMLLLPFFASGYNLLIKLKILILRIWKAKIDSKDFGPSV